MNDTADHQICPEFPDIPAFVEVLNRHRVRYVVIGGAAAQFSVPGQVTHDVDFTQPPTVPTWTISRQR
jgi:hypothetical protein